MAEIESKPAGRNQAKAPETSSVLQMWRPFENLRREIDRLFDDFDRPFRRSLFDVQPLSWSGTPAVDVVEKNNAYEIVAELPGLDEKNVEVKLSDGGLTITAKKEEEKEEKKKDYHIQERHFGSFERSFRLPEGIDVDRIDATFKKGLLRVTLPKKAEAQESSKKIEVKSS
jgi:HSP20 family protein